MTKKGQSALDLVVFLVILFVIALLGIIVVKVWGGINTGLQAKSSDIGTAAATASSDSNTGFQRGFDMSMSIAIGIMYIGLFITSRYIGTDPMWFFINIFLLIIALSLAAILGNVYDTATNNASFVTERAAMPGMVFIASHFLEFAIGAFAMILLGLFAKPSGGGGQY